MTAAHAQARPCHLPTPMARGKAVAASMNPPSNTSAKLESGSQTEAAT